MPLERFVSCFVSCMACLLLGLGGAATAEGKTYSLTGGGGQLAIGGFPLPLPLPVQQTFTPNMTGSLFPPLGIPVAGLHRPILSGTTAMTAGQKLSIPAGVLSRPAQQGTVAATNPWLYAAATNLGFAWPAAPAVLSTGARTGNTTITFYPWFGGSIRYSNAKGRKFGGPARFAISHGQQPAGRIPNSPVTFYFIAVITTGNPPCTHPVFGGTNSACIAALGAAWPNSLGAVGGPVSVTDMTLPLGLPKPGWGFGQFGSSPVGTVLQFAWTGGNGSGVTNMATSYGYPWTTGMLTIKMPTAYGRETYTITGMDNRSPGGAGTIQLVAGSLSARTLSGPNANRGWIRLVLTEVLATPTMSRAGFAATAGLLLLAAGYALRRRLSG